MITTISPTGILTPSYTYSFEFFPDKRTKTYKEIKFSELLAPVVKNKHGLKKTEWVELHLKVIDRFRDMEMSMFKKVLELSAEITIGDLEKPFEESKLKVLLISSKGRN